MVVQFEVIDNMVWERCMSSVSVLLDKHAALHQYKAMAAG